MSTYKRSSSSRDLAIADQSNEDQQLMCLAPMCPNRWAYSESIGPNIRGVCTAHHLAPHEQWSAVTERELEREARRLTARFTPKIQAPSLTAAEKAAMLRKMRATLAGKAVQE